MDSLAPNLFVKDIRATIEFYKLLGFNLIMSVPGEGEGEPAGKGELVWAMVTNGNVTFMFQTCQSLGNDLPQISRQDGGSLLFYIKIQNIRTFFSSIQDKVPIVKGLEKTFYGATEFSITDPNNLFDLIQFIRAQLFLFHQIDLPVDHHHLSGRQHLRFIVGIGMIRLRHPQAAFQQVHFLARPLTNGVYPKTRPQRLYP